MILQPNITLMVTGRNFDYSDKSSIIYKKNVKRRKKVNTHFLRADILPMHKLDTQFLRYAFAGRSYINGILIPCQK